MRGAGPDDAAVRGHRGIIPACAGSSRGLQWRGLHRRDHPRVCGEQWALTCAVTAHSGSSPRVRGAVAGAVAEGPGDGIIPACAGSSSLRHPAQSAAWDHPRACGEQPMFAFGCSVQSGSSPRVRGAGVDGVAHVLVCGIIPARAGSSALPFGDYMLEGDHPRACGEQTPRVELVDGWMGSSPRVRGAGCESRSDDYQCGIIPARAGSRCLQPCFFSLSRDHPRACGEQTPAPIWRFLNVGSSPRVRGADLKIPAQNTLSL